MRPAGAAAAAAAAGVLLFARRAGAASAVASANEAGITPTPTNYVGMYIGAGSSEFFRTARTRACHLQMDLWH
jgi:hypothetical protein